MKAGVSTDPCGVTKRPRRAEVPASACNRKKEEQLEDMDLLAKLQAKTDQPAASIGKPIACGLAICQAHQSPRSFNPCEVSFSRTSLRLVTPKFLHSSSSSPVRRINSPMVLT